MARTSPAMKVLLVVHRYLGVAVGLVMTLWCLSGFVMMYRGYPHLSEAARLCGLAPIRLEQSQIARLPLGDSDRVTGFGLEMMAGRPVLHVQRDPQGPERLDLSTGAVLTEAPSGTAATVAQAYRDGARLAGKPSAPRLMALDQWTVEGAAHRGAVYRIALGDPADTWLYVAARTGEAVQAASRADRFWGWLGAVPHWLYPTLLRRNGPLWDAVVVWTSLLGCFLTATGLYVGVARFRRRRNGRWSPYRGGFYWHHILGLVFGVFTLTWVTSGLFTMNPWGFLDTDVGASARSDLAGWVSGGDVRHFLAVVTARATPDIIQYEAAPLGGRLFVLARTREGAETRLDRNAKPAPLQPAELESALGNLSLGAPTDFDRLSRPDAYYYPGADQATRFPVYRVRFADRHRTTLYLDAVSGQVAQAVDDTARLGRWVRYGLHDWDFPILRTRPLWDVLVWALLAGVSASVGLGAWLALKRAWRDLRSMSALIRRRTARARGAPEAGAP